MSPSFARPDEFMEQAARRLLAESATTRPHEICLTALVGRLEIELKLVPARAFAGVLLRDGDFGTILVADHLSIGRQRFTIGHELGHAILHPPTNPRQTCGLEDLAVYSAATRPREREANVFATELLMPREMFTPLIRFPPSMGNIKELSDEFRTSLTATAIRFCQLCGERSAVVFSQKGAIGWTFSSPDFGFNISLGATLDSDTFAYDANLAKNVPGEFTEVPLGAWVDEEVPRGTVVQEVSVAMPKQHAALTLLWLADVDEELSELW